MGTSVLVLSLSEKFVNCSRGQAIIGVAIITIRTVVLVFCPDYKTRRTHHTVEDLHINEFTFSGRFVEGDTWYMRGKLVYCSAACSKRPRTKTLTSDFSTCKWL